MTYVSFAEEHPLDVQPLIAALKFQPTDFEFEHGALLHVPSRHRFEFDGEGRVTVMALCGCAGRSVSREQGDALLAAFRSWRQFYWQPLAIDREFASHFAKPDAWVRLMRDIRMAWRRFRGRAAPVTVGARALATPAE